MPETVLTSQWEAILDELEERCRHYEAVVTGHGRVPPQPAVPVAPGPLPEELLPRAAAVLHRLRDCERRAGELVAKRPRARAYADASPIARALARSL